jgi:hypothetical protein
MMLVDYIQFSDDKTGCWIKCDVQISDRARLRVTCFDGQALLLTLDQVRALYRALERVLEGR